MPYKKTYHPTYLWTRLRATAPKCHNRPSKAMFKS